MSLKVVPFRFEDEEWKALTGLINQDLDAALRGLVEDRITTYLHWRKQGPQPSPIFTAGMMRYHTGGRRSQETKEEDARILTGRWGKYPAPGRPPDRKTGELCWLASQLYALARGAGLRHTAAAVFTWEVLSVVTRARMETIDYAIGCAVKDYRLPHPKPL